MEKFLEKLFDIKKIPTKLIFAIWLSSTLILFVPEKFLTKLNLSDFLKEYGKYLGIAFIISSAFLIITFLSYLSRLISNKKFEKKIKQKIIEDLNYLDFHEKALLREFYIQNKQTLQLPFDNDTVVGLANKRIIYQASSTGFTYTHGVYFPFSMTRIALENFKFDLIDLPTEPTDEQKNKILNDRPNWAKEKSRIEDRQNTRWF